jgi:uncharacterized protein YjbI with pentapeptide repeats
MENNKNKNDSKISSKISGFKKCLSSPIPEYRKTYLILSLVCGVLLSGLFYYCGDDMFFYRSRIFSGIFFALLSLPTLATLWYLRNHDILEQINKAKEANLFNSFSKAVELFLQKEKDEKGENTPRTEVNVVGLRLLMKLKNEEKAFVEEIKQLTIGKDLRGIDLSNADLRDANLSDANLSGAKLDKANLSDANLSDANLSGANFYYTDLKGANLMGANLMGANLSGANLSGANLSGAKFEKTKINLYDKDYEKIKDRNINYLEFKKYALIEFNYYYNSNLYIVNTVDYDLYKITPLSQTITFNYN